MQRILHVPIKATWADRTGRVWPRLAGDGGPGGRVWHKLAGDGGLGREVFALAQARHSTIPTFLVVYLS